MILARPMTLADSETSHQTALRRQFRPSIPEATSGGGRSLASPLALPSLDVGSRLDHRLRQPGLPVISCDIRATPRENRERLAVTRGNQEIGIEQGGRPETLLVRSDG